eukprot:TRINITY_DN22463_c0_g1_i3.p1 TRINITY_DN22463_c0_g1~~TRINITY_DN22463_c0_g1_i3.p1  ORF type:complete len:146 (+),score=39.57 TRINITY_DN22463_c0_g1_i3:56-493(+)
MMFSSSRLYLCLYLHDSLITVYYMFIIFFFFFKQKTAYEMLRSLVGSEMCIRDSLYNLYIVVKRKSRVPVVVSAPPIVSPLTDLYFKQTSLAAKRGFTFTAPITIYYNTCLLYTSDAADEEDSVDLGGRRIIKKKKKENLRDEEQ